MRKKTEAMLHELAPAARGSHDAGSCDQPSFSFILYL